MIFRNFENIAQSSGRIFCTFSPESFFSKKGFSTGSLCLKNGESIEMDNKVKKLINQLKDNEIKAIKDAHEYTWSQLGVLTLIISYISDIRHDRANLLNIEHRTIDLEGFRIQGQYILDFIKEVRFSGESSKTYLIAIAKNFFRGTTHPVYEISHNSKIKNLFSTICFDDNQHFQNFIDILSIVRHFLSHNYTQKVILKNWDMQNGSTIAQLKSRHNDGIISFNYNGKKYFPEIYKEIGFEITISLDLSKISVGSSLFNAISIKELFLLGELCNNILKKSIDIIN